MSIKVSESRHEWHETLSWLMRKCEVVGLAGFEPATPRFLAMSISVVCSSQAELQALSSRVEAFLF
jgi:hypothetical protein